MTAKDYLKCCKHGVLILEKDFILPYMKRYHPSWLVDMVTDDLSDDRYRWIADCHYAEGKTLKECANEEDIECSYSHVKRLHNQMLVEVQENINRMRASYDWFNAICEEMEEIKEDKKWRPR